MASTTAAWSFQEQSSYFPSFPSYSSHQAQDHIDEGTSFSQLESFVVPRPSPGGLDEVDLELLRCPVMLTPGGTPIKMGRMDRRQEYLWEESCLKQGRRQSVQQIMADGQAPLNLSPPPSSKAQTVQLQSVAGRNDSQSTPSQEPLPTSLDSTSRSRSSTVSALNNTELPDASTSDSSSKSSQARRVTRGLPEMRILGPQIKAHRPPRTSRTRSEPFETVRAVFEEKTRRNLPTRPKPLSIVSSPQLRLSKPRHKLRSSASFRTRLAEGSDSPATSPMEPHIPGAYPEIFDHPYTPTGPEVPSPTEDSAADDRILSQEVTYNDKSYDEPPRPATRFSGSGRPSLFKSISRDFLRFIGVAVKQDHDASAHLPAHSSQPSTPPGHLPSTPTDGEEAERKKKQQRLRRWLSRVSLNPVVDEGIPVAPKTSPAHEVPRSSSTNEVVRYEMPPVSVTPALRKKPSTPVFPGLRRVSTPPMNAKSGKLQGFFFDFKPPQSEEEKTSRPPTSPSCAYGESTVYTPGPVGTTATRRAEMDWFRIRMDEIMAEDDEEEEMANFEWDVPEHLPGSPLCPLSPKHKSGGKGVCIYHGRRQTQTERQLVEAYL